MIDRMQHRPAQQNAKSLARLAAEEAFMPLPASRAESDDMPEPVAQPLRRPSIAAPVDESDHGRAPKVFRLARPAAEVPVEPEPVPDPVVASSPRRVVSDKRPGPVNVVFSKPVDAPPAARPVDAERLADPASFGGVSYQQAVASVQELDAILADIAFAQSFKRASLNWGDV